MGWTKRQFVTMALEQIGIASYTFDLAPEQLESGLRQLDAMMAMWNAMGVRLGYPLHSSPTESDLDEETNVPDMATEAVFLNLAIRLAPSYGRVMAPSLRDNAHRALLAVMTITARPIEQQVTALPRGAGSRRWKRERPFLDPPTDDLLAGPDDELEFD